MLAPVAVLPCDKPTRSLPHGQWRRGVVARVALDLDADRAQNVLQVDGLFPHHAEVGQHEQGALVL